MGHTGIHAFGDRVRRIGLGRFAVVVELGIPWIHPWGVSSLTDWPVNTGQTLKQKKGNYFRFGSSCLFMFYTSLFENNLYV